MCSCDGGPGAESTGLSIGPLSFETFNRDDPMENGGLNAKGIFMRLAGSLVLVYATFNPEGFSFFDWAVKPLFQGDLAVARAQAPLKVLVALFLIGLWTFFLRTTRRSIGWVGGLLVLAIAAVIVWLLIDWHLLRPSS